MLIAHPSVPSIFVVGMKLIFPNFKIADMTFMISWISSPLKFKSSSAFCKRQKKEYLENISRLGYYDRDINRMIKAWNHSKIYLALIFLLHSRLKYSFCIICSSHELIAFLEYESTFLVTCFFINQIPFTLKLVQNIKRQRLLIKHCLSYFLKIPQR